MEEIKEKSENKFLGTEKVGKLLKMFAIPCVLSLVIQALYNLADQIFIGHSSLGVQGNSATGVVYPLTVIALAIGLFIGDGTAACISINQGRGQTKQVHKAVGTAISVSLALSLIMMAICLPLSRPILNLLAAPTESVLNLATEYSTWIIIGFPLYIIATVLNPIIRTDGSPKYAMLAMTAGAIINIGLDALFIFGLKMGMNGAALATFIGQLITFLLSIGYFFRSKSFKLKLSSFVPDFKLLWQSLKLGVSSFLTQVSIVVITIVTSHILGVYMHDDAALGLLNNAFKIFGIVISIVIGVAAGGQPIIGYNYGAKNYDRVKQAFKYIVITTVIVGIVATILFESIPQYLFAIFLDTANVTEFGILLFRIYFGFILFTCFTKAVAIFFQAIGSPVKSILIASLRDMIFLVPLAILLPLTTHTIYPFYWSAPISDVLTTIIAIVLLVDLFKKMSKAPMPAQKPQEVVLPSKKGVIVTISRQHGAGGREIGQKLAKKLGVPFYDKELAFLAAQESGLAQEYIENLDQKDSILYDLYLSTDCNQTAIAAQEKALRKIAQKGSCVIVGRAADFVLREYNPYKVFVYAPIEFKKQRIMENYGDGENLAVENIEKADRRRAKFYQNVTGNVWGEAQNYNLSVDSSVGIDKVVEQIYLAIKPQNKD